jgi:hypothetical protein
MLINTGMDDFMRGNPPKNPKDEFHQKRGLLPVFLSSTIFKLGNVAVMAATLKYWVVFCYIVPFLGGLILYHCCGNNNDRDVRFSSTRTETGMCSIILHEEVVGKLYFL